MITYKKACEIANGIRQKEFPSFKYSHVVDIADRWSFSFSVYSPDDRRTMTPAPSFFVFKEDGRVEWYGIPPLENLDILESGKTIDLIE